MMVLLPLLSLATAVLAAPSPMADYVYDGSDAEFEVSPSLNQQLVLLCLLYLSVDIQINIRNTNLKSEAFKSDLVFPGL